MATRPPVKPVQDLPPSGGFPKVPFRRDLRSRGPSGIALFAAAFAFTGFGFYKIGQTNIDRRNYKKIKREARMAILPFLMAEMDREQMKTIESNLTREREVMKGNPNWHSGEQYRFSKRWADPSTEF